VLTGAMKDWFRGCGDSPTQRAAFVALAGAISLVQVSIAASQILLFAAIMLAAWIWMQEGRPWSRPPSFTLPLLCFVAWTLIAVLGARHVLLGLSETKKFFLYSILFLVPCIVRSRFALLQIYRAIFLVSVAAAGKGLVQFLQNPHRNLLDRIKGFMSTWMTYSGLLMLVLVVLAAYAIRRPARRNWWVLPLATLIVAGLVLSETRNAGFGAIAGLAVVFQLRRPRANLVLAAFLIALYLAVPAAFKQRVRSSFDPNDPNTRNRIELFQTSVRLIGDNPWLGVGPKNVNREALRYRGTNEFPDWMYQHLHNNFLQVAAERGIPGLVLWLWLMCRLAWDALAVYRSAGKVSSPDEASMVASSAALGAWAALLVAGLFEWNFGDSEVLMLFLFMMAAPYAVAAAEKRNAMAGT
jgi:putative inorganic carbon (hco3(-)) transporter